MSGSCKPIGFFDSGVGGISVLKTACRLLPGENYIYFGDNLNAPYGDKSEEEIKKLTLDACGFLFGKGVKAIVIACNTATSAAVIMMREAYNIPVISMEPAVKPAMEGRQAGRVLVLATPATVSQARYLGLIERLGAHSDVISVGCGGLAEMIEDGRTDEASIHAYLSQRLAFLSGQAIGAVVLGCTHYSFVEAPIKSFIDKFTHTDCPVFDGRHGTARQLQRVLQERDILCGGSKAGRIQFFASGPGFDISVFKKTYDNYAE
jgi:glutamate racemase